MKTSVNLQLADIPQIDEACEASGESCSVIINRCLRKFFASHPARLAVSRSKRLVEYQPKGAGYRIVGIVFDLDVYNANVNFRVFCRLSVSKMVTMAIAEFLNEVVIEIEKGVKANLNYIGYRHFRRHNDRPLFPEWNVTWVVEGKKQKKKKKNR